MYTKGFIMPWFVFISSMWQVPDSQTESETPRVYGIERGASQSKCETGHALLLLLLLSF